MSKNKNSGMEYALKYEYGQFLGEFELFEERDLNSYYKTVPFRFCVRCEDEREFYGEANMNTIQAHFLPPYTSVEKMEESAFKALLRDIETAYIKSLPYMDRKVREICHKTIVLEK